MIKVEKNIKLIIQEVQEYITNYENGTRYNYCTNIDVIFNTIYNSDEPEAALDIDIKPKEIENVENHKYKIEK